jgi:hypothetical protein
MINMPWFRKRELSGVSDTHAYHLRLKKQTPNVHSLTNKLRAICYCLEPFTSSETQNAGWYCIFDRMEEDQALWVKLLGKRWHSI